MVSPASPLINPPEKANTTCEQQSAVESKVSLSSPNIIKNDENKEALKPTTGNSGRKRVVKSVVATPSPLAKDSNLTRKAQQINITSSEGKKMISSPLAYAEVAPRRGKAASARPHQGVPFNAKPTPSPAKSSGM